MVVVAVAVVWDIKWDLTLCNLAGWVIICISHQGGVFPRKGQTMVALSKRCFVGLVATVVVVKVVVVVVVMIVEMVVVLCFGGG